MQDKQTIHKSELVKQAAATANLPDAVAGRVIDGLLHTIRSHLCNGFKVSITDFGTFEAQSKPERSGRNPQTGEAITIAAHMAVKFKAGKALKDAVNA